MNESSSVAADAAANPDLRAVISWLFVYPIKSCAGVEVQQAILTETGLEFDRAWMVVDANGAFLTQRELPRMALIQPQLRQYDMVLRAPGMLALHVALDAVEQPARVHLWDEALAAYDMGATAAQWFTDFLGQRARLVRFDPEQKRLSSLDWTGGIEARNQFNDGYPLLLLSEASLAGLNQRLAQGGQPPASVQRFRPNIVIADSTHPAADRLAPHDEDRLAQLHIATEQGEVLLKPVKPCPRCPIPNVNPLTAEVTTSVGDALQAYRQHPRLNGAVAFGMNLIVLGDSPPIDRELKVGQNLGGNFLFE